MGLSTQLSAPNRNRQSGRLQDHILSRDAVRSILAQLREIFGLATRPVLIIILPPDIPAHSKWAELAADKEEHRVRLRAARCQLFKLVC